MSSLNSKLGSLIVQLRNRINEVQEAFDQTLVEFEQQKAENEAQYQEQLEQLKQERREWAEEKANMEQLVASAGPVVDLNVGGEKMSTSRATLTLAEGSLLATMFSGKWEDKLMKDANGCIFLDYDPVLFRCLLNQLRAWSDATVKRVFRLPVGSEQSFIEFVRLLKFDEQFIDGEIGAAKVVQSKQEVERFRTVSDSNVQVTDNNRRCELIGQNNSWQCVFGTLNYSTGIHQVHFILEKGTTNILMGICSQNRLPSGPSFYDNPTTHGWFTHGYVVTNGRGSSSRCPEVQENDILELTINCDGRSLSILNEKTRAQNSMQVNINEAPFPWCLLVLFYHVGSRVSLA